MVDEKYLLDANTFMTPYESFYSFDLAPGFWTQLKPTLLKENVAIMDVVKNEVDKGRDSLTEWMDSVDGLVVLDRREPEIIMKYSEVLKYLQDSELYTDKALRTWSNASVADPWLIAAASAKGYTLVTFEKSAGKITSPSGKPKIPDVAREFGVSCVDLYYFIRKMGIKWN
ncbi:MAG: DUF4411 family protein [Lachnospiraceae bacterium]|nr:DUF4411 family protein [Lachnospiraceae bacterium]